MISKIVKDTPPSGIRKFFDLANEMKDAISLSIGEPDFVTPANIVKAGVDSLLQGQTHYSPNAGFIEVRNEISNYLKRRYSLSYDPKNQIIVTVGGSEAIDIALRTIVTAGDEVIVPEPSFVSYKPCVAFTGATPVVISLREEDEFKLTPELLEKAITSKTKAIILSFPSNPTGAIMTHDELKAIVKVLEDKDILVISDDIYSELTYGGKHASIASFDSMKDKTLVINGFSKAFAMTGWRLGYVCGHPELISEMYKVHQYAIMCSPTTAQFAAIEALKNGQEAVDAMVSEYDSRRKLLLEGLRSIGLSCFEPKGAFYMFPCLKSTGLSSTEFCERLLLEEKVAIVPGCAFGESGEGFARVCYAVSRENIEIALERMQRFVGKLKS